jgi:hypothetical protein
VILCPRLRKQKQFVMNHRQSTSIPGNYTPENQWGEGRGEGEQASLICFPLTRRAYARRPLSHGERCISASER